MRFIPSILRVFFLGFAASLGVCHRLISEFSSHPSNPAHLGRSLGPEPYR